MKKILILSTSDNVHSDAIQTLLEAGDHPFIRINFDQVPNVPSISTDQEALMVDNERVHIKSVFLHHPKVRIAATISDDLDRRLGNSQWTSLIQNLPFTLPPKTRWLNNPTAIKANSSTFLQLNAAKNVGFRTPLTCITTDIKTLRSFTKGLPVILKPGNLTGLNLEGQRLLAHLISADDISPEILKNAPCLFQEYIPKAFELRVHVIGQTVLTCRIDSQAIEQTTIDWRNYDLKNTPHVVYNLPTPIAQQCVELTKSLGYELGIIDLIVTPEEEFVFLECNSQGHWLWIEQLTQLPITETVIKYLMD